MPNGTYGGVRGRKTKVGGKLTTFVFLLLYYLQVRELKLGTSCSGGPARQRESEGIFPQSPGGAGG